MKKGKFLTALAILSMFSLSLAACGDVNVPGGESGEVTPGDKDYSKDERYPIYQLAAAAGFEGTYEEWLATIKGSDGTTILTGTVAPTATQGKNGDLYLDSTSFSLYVKVAGEWNMIGTLKGPKGDQGEPGAAGQNGTNGQNGVTPHIGENGNWFIGDTDTGVHAQGPKGDQGDPGSSGVQAPVITIGENGNWFIDGVDTGKPSQGSKGDQGAAGAPGQNGTNGTNGVTPHIGENGNWFIGDTDTGVHAQGPKGDQGAAGAAGENGKNGQDGAPGQKGQDGAAVLTGEGKPTSELGKVGDSYIDVSSWDYYVKQESGWAKVGNIQGAPGEGGGQGQTVVHTVSFNTHGGGDIPNQEVSHGEKIARPENPSKDGYEFINWTYQGEPWSFIGYVVTEDMELDANYKENFTCTIGEYTVPLNYDEKENQYLGYFSSAVANSEISLNRGDEVVSLLAESYEGNNAVNINGKVLVHNDAAKAVIYVKDKGDHYEVWLDGYQKDEPEQPKEIDHYVVTYDGDAKEGETINYDKLIVRAYYKDGAIEDLREEAEYKLNGKVIDLRTYVFQEAGQYKIEVLCGEYQTYFMVEISSQGGEEPDGKVYHHVCFYIDASTFNGWGEVSGFQFELSNAEGERVVSNGNGRGSLPQYGLEDAYAVTGFAKTTAPLTTAVLKFNETKNGITEQKESLPFTISYAFNEEFVADETHPYQAFDFKVTVGDPWVQGEDGITRFTSVASDLGEKQNIYSFMLGMYITELEDYSSIDAASFKLTVSYLEDGRTLTETIKGEMSPDGQPLVAFKKMVVPMGIKYLTAILSFEKNGPTIYSDPVNLEYEIDPTYLETHDMAQTFVFIAHYVKDAIPRVEGNIVITISDYESGGGGGETPEQPKIRSLEAHYKGELEVGQPLDLDILTVDAIYDDETVKSVKLSAEYIYNGSKMNIKTDKFDKPGKYEITVTYEGLSAKFMVNVIDTQSGEVTLQDITVHYTKDGVVGGKLDLADLYVDARYSDGHTENITNKATFTVDGETIDIAEYTFTVVGRTVFEVSYGGKLISFTVVVKEEAQPEQPTVTRVNARYSGGDVTVGDTLDLSKLTVMADYSDGHSEDVKDKAQYSIRGTVINLETMTFDSVGSFSIDVSFDGALTGFVVNVVAAEGGQGGEGGEGGEATPEMITYNLSWREDWVYDNNAAILVWAWNAEGAGAWYLATPSGDFGATVNLPNGIVGFQLLRFPTGTTPETANRDNKYNQSADVRVVAGQISYTVTW